MKSIWFVTIHGLELQKVNESLLFQTLVITMGEIDVLLTEADQDNDLDAD